MRGAADLICSLALRTQLPLLTFSSLTTFSTDSGRAAFPMIRALRSSEVITVDGLPQEAIWQRSWFAEFSFKSLFGNAVLRWEFRPGSALYLVWTQSRTDSERMGEFQFNRSFSRLWQVKPDNIVMLKFTY